VEVDGSRRKQGQGRLSSKSSGSMAPFLGRPIFFGPRFFPTAVRSQGGSGWGRRCVDIEGVGGWHRVSGTDFGAGTSGDHRVKRARCGYASAFFNSAS